MTPESGTSFGEYRAVDLEGCLDLVLAIKDAGKRWHSHVLSPGYIHNPRPELFGLVIENDTDGIAYLAFSNDFPEVDKQLVKLLHGDDILDAPPRNHDEVSAVVSSELLSQLRAVDAKGSDWHHHMHFPDCVFNPHRGAWAISVEDGAGNSFSETYKQEPLDILREIEVMYFRKLEAKCHESDN